VSALVVLLFGVPRGSVLAPMLFTLYIAEVFDVLVAWLATAHLYADDGQLYVRYSPVLPPLLLELMFINFPFFLAPSTIGILLRPRSP